MSTKQRVFSGIQPSGVPTLGNYLGAIRNWVPLQDTHDAIYCVVDLHAITTWQDPAALATQTREMAAALIALSLPVPGREIEAARHMRAEAPHASPNRRLIALADAALGCEGRLIAARDAMGPARPASAGPLVRLTPLV